MVDTKPQRAIDCMAQHIKTFREQSLKGIKADFGEPCAECPHSCQCSYQWLDIMEPILDNSNIKISMIFPE